MLVRVETAAHNPIKVNFSVAVERVEPGAETRVRSVPVPRYDEVDDSADDGAQIPLLAWCGLLFDSASGVFFANYGRYTGDHLRSSMTLPMCQN